MYPDRFGARLRIDPCHFRRRHPYPRRHRFAVAGLLACHQSYLLVCQSVGLGLG